MNSNMMETKALKAERSFLLARLAFVNSRLGQRASSQTSSTAPASLEKFDRTWKKGTRLTPSGKLAVKRAFKAGMNQSTVARLFKVTTAAANFHHKAWKTEN